MTERRAKGTYTLLVRVDRAVDIDVGALGVREYPRGYYAYTGSAFGSGGFSRIERHQRVAAGDHDVRHWHVDYLLGDPTTRLVEVAKSPGVDAECEIARSLPGRSVPDFGASDCDCGSHLTHAADRTELSAAIERVHSSYEGPG